MKFRKDYAAANVPMLPVVAPAVEVTRKILWYSYAMVAATLALVPYAGWIYGIAALGLGGWFLAAAHSLHAQVRADASTRALSGTGSRPVVVTATGRPLPMRLFHLSIAYLTLLFGVVAVTALLPWGHW
jgi:protoheme IX farnesyltransferase